MHGSAVVRDPDTGKFVSATEAGFDFHREVIAGELLISIEAADLTTGADRFVNEGTDAQVVDMSDVLDTGEVFDLHGFHATVAILPERTATAEHAYQARYVWATDVLDNPAAVSSVTQRDATVTATRRQREDASVLVQGGLQASGDFADSATGVGGGADQRSQEYFTNFPMLGIDPPTLDEDDEVACPMVLLVRGSDDQGIDILQTITLYGTEREL